MKRSKAFNLKDAKGKVVFKTTRYITKSAKGKIKITKTGKIILMKGTKEGIYKFRVMVTARGNASYDAKSKVIKLAIKVR